ncbi:Oxidase [Lachnellula subtilissima]|uniref:Oxidase n=1 Tax=Lachnellula subtilissima TaxID=602034 RepID=A0A8H8RE86_9HELO|nr:Oxidase [Lachnellula subtilissima]
MTAGRGFVRDSSTTHSEVGNIAVFHQIHCVHELRVAYYTLLDRLKSGNGSASPYLENLAALDGTKHIAHCFDYLRRVLMCAADTNIEYPDENGLLTGWGSKRSCRDYESVVMWAERWRVDNRTEIQ